MPPPFTSFTFLFFFFICFPIYWLLNGKTKLQNTFLLVISYFIYCYVMIWLGIILFISTIVNYCCGYIIGLKNNKKSEKKRILYLSILFNILYLGVFKYFNFFSIELNNFLSILGLNMNPIILKLLLPIGISYYTLQAISYNIEIYKGKLSPTKDFITFALFLAYFPKMTAGPIEAPGSLIPKISSKKYLDQKKISSAIQLLLLGLFMKIVIADFIGERISNFYENPTDYSSTEAIIVVWLFSLQIYADFFGYTNIVRGISKLLGLDLGINFNQPYLSTNIREFWRRWHISFSNWLRDYAYIPLGGNRKGSARSILNILVVFLICGLWHGAGINFMIWGLLHGVFIAIHRIFLKIFQNLKFYKVLTLKDNLHSKKAKTFKTIYRFIGFFITFQFVSFAWIFFHTDNFNSAIHIIILAYSFKYDFINTSEIKILINILIFSSIFILLIDVAQYKVKTHEIFTNLHWIIKGILYTVIIVMIIFFQFNIEEMFIYEAY